MVARGLAYLGGAAFVLLLLSATGLLGVVTRGLGAGGGGPSGGVAKAVPGSGHKWREMHAAQVQDLRAHDAEGLQVIWFGDDLVESWRGTAGGGVCPGCTGVPEVWTRHFGGVWQAQAYGIAGTRAANLLWRVRKGLRPQRQAPVQILHAGSADLDAAFAAGGEAAAVAAAPGIVASIEECVKLLHVEQPNGRVLLLALLPRAPSGAGTGGNATAGALWPTPLASGIAAVNDHLEALANRYPAVHYVDCGSALLTPGGPERQQRIDPALVPDGRAPGPEGMHRLGLCLDSLTHHLVTAAPPVFLTAVDEEDDPTPEQPENLQMRYVEEAKPQAAAAAAGNQAAGAAAGADTGAATGAGAVAGAADAVIQPQIEAAAATA